MLYIFSKDCSSFFGGGGGEGGAPNFFIKILLIQPWKSFKKFTQPQMLINLKINTHPWPKGYHSGVTHVLYHFCDILKFHVVCTCTFFVDTIRLLINDQDSDSDWFTYCIDIWLLTLLFSLQYLSESCFGNGNTFLLPSPWVVLFFTYPTFYLLKMLFTQPFRNV